MTDDITAPRRSDETASSSADSLTNSRIGPNLFVAGAPKCGSTSMHRYLSQHPEIFMSAARYKEPQFWIYEGARPAWTGPGDDWMNGRIVTNRDEYFALFDDAGGYPFRGEASPYYLASEPALRKILREIPDARFVLMLRDPVKRAESLWRHLWGQGREQEKTVELAMAQDERRRQLGWEPFWQYREMGLYGKQVQTLHSLVPRQRVKIVFYDDFSSDPQGAMRSVFRWLGVAEDVDVDTANRFMVTPRVADTRRNRVIQTAVSRKSSVKRIVPQSVRQPMGRWLLGRLTTTSAGDDDQRTVDQPAAASVRDTFRADLQLLQDLVGDVPASWLR